MPLYADNAKDSTTTTGTGSFTLVGTIIPGYRTIASCSEIPNGKTTKVFIEDSSGNWEIAEAMLDRSVVSTGILTITTVKYSSNNNNIVSFGDGIKYISIVSDVNDLVVNFDYVSDIPTNFIGVSRIGKDLYVGNNDEDGIKPVGTIAPINIPTGFRWTNPPINIKRWGNNILTDFDITDYVPTTSNVYYLDPVNGLDTNSGARATPLKNLYSALYRPGVIKIIIINLTADYIARGIQSWNQAAPAQSHSVIVEGNYRYISVMTTNSSAPTWTVNGTYSNVYQTALATANCTGVTDLKTTKPLTYVDKNRVTQTINYVKWYDTYNVVTSLALVASTPGSWYNDGTVCYVNPRDGRSLVKDTYMQPTGNSSNMRFPSVNNMTVYAQGIDFVGGRPIDSIIASSVTDTILALNNCSVQGGGNTGTGKGMNISAFQNVYTYRCLAASNFTDGFSYHSYEGDGTTPNTSPNFIEIENVAVANGTTGSSDSSSNATTSHDYCNGIRINCIYINSDDRPVADTNYAYTWTIGGYVGQAVQTSSAQSIAAVASGTKMWVDSFYAQPGVNPRWISVTGATISYFNSGLVVNDPTGGGIIKSYYG